MTSATLENIRSWIGLGEDARELRIKQAVIEFDRSVYVPRKADMSDPRPTPDRVTDAMRAEIRERLGRGGNGLISPGTTTRRVDTANPDNPGRVDDGEPMRDKQRGLAMVLLERDLRAVNPAAAEAGLKWFKSAEPTMTKAQASDWITRIRAMIAAGPSAPVHTHDIRSCTAYPCDACSRHTNDAPPSTTSVPAFNNAWARWRELAAQLVEFGGRYGARFAVATEAGSDNDLAFWWIVPGKHQHEGKFWLRQIIGGQGPVRVRMSVEAMISVAEKIIAAGPKESLLLYGQALGHCGHCNLELTNQESRDFGIGPTCRKNKEW